MSQLRTIAAPSVLEGLRGMIQNGALAPGAPIGQAAVAQRLGVSRIPLREALKTLEAQGLVVHSPHRGYTVARLSLAELEENYRIRELLEDEAVRLAVPRLRDADVDRIASLAAQVERAVGSADLVAVMQTNRAFHFALLTPCGMSRMVTMIRMLWDATDAYRAVYFDDEQRRAAVVHEHAQIVDAVRRRDAETVVSCLSAHRRHAVTALRTLLVDMQPG